MSDRVLDVLSKIFQISLIPTVALTAWMMWGLFSGRLADVSTMSAKDHADALHMITTLSQALNVSLAVTVVSGGLIYMEMESIGVIYLIIAAVFAFGVKLVMDLVGGDGGQAHLTAGEASTAMMNEIRLMSFIVGVPGILLAIKTLIGKVFNSRHQDLTNLSYGKDAAQTERKRPLIGAMAKCWELPFCREGIRVRCPIFHAQTKCWKEKVGCMCEENIILLAMGGSAPDPNKTQPLTKESGFVPLGDLLTKNAEERKASIPTRVGPRGVRIPTNPHLSEAQKRIRCHNCAIFNEHQRLKYQFLSVPVTLAVPLLVVLKFDDLRQLVDQFLAMLDKIVAQITFHAITGSNLSHEIKDNLSIELIFIICLTLVVMTWAQRLLEYTMFKIKI